MKRPRREAPVARAQAPTAFGVILARLLRRSPGARAAALVDPEGETVDYAGQLPDYFTRLAGAYFRIVMDDVGAGFVRLRLGTPHQVAVRAGTWTFTVRRLTEGYAMVLVFQRRAFTVSARALAVCDDELASEAGWPPVPRSSSSWFPIEVQSLPSDRRRPGRVRLGKRWYGVDILGHLVDLPRERGYRCRLSSGAEVTLIREVSGQWYSEELLPPDHPAAERPKVLGGKTRRVGPVARSKTSPGKKA